MKKKLLFVCVAIAALFLTSCQYFKKSSPNTVQSAQDTQTQIVSQIQECSRIYTAEYEVSKIIIHEDEKRIKGNLAGIGINIGLAGTQRVIAIPITGVLKGYVDLSDIKPENVRIGKDSIEVIMPDPKVELVSTSINHKDIKENESFFSSKFSDAELSKIQQQGRQMLVASIPSLGILPQVRECSVRTLVGLLEKFGYTTDQIKITFRQNLDSPSSKDLMKETFIDNTQKQ